MVEVGAKQWEVVVCSEGVDSGRLKLQRVVVPDENVVYHMALYTMGDAVRSVCPSDGGDQCVRYIW